ncbi:hypothetical protein D840_02752 [Enterococcus faecalis 20.SD.W.06]|uniref:hypothetical protein n=1 Tax=Enterococcus faecalis TaxID=1351 RepID=UPI00037C1549|nr:hypothetical protein [Enterococcus faecalis]EPI00368.1 hypothetical protein D840_02752 [Enterococcus faecalis 20.SD.W.06]
MNVFDVIGIVAIPVAILCFHNWIISERLSEAENRINRLTIQQMNSRPTFQDSRTGAILPTRQQAIPPQLKGEKPMLTANEAFLVREAVREKIETLRDAVRHESAKHPAKQDIYTLKNFQAELARYEIAYQKMLNEVGC